MHPPGRRHGPPAPLSRTLLLGACLLLLHTVSACGREPAALAKSPGPVTIAYPVSVATGLVQVALEKGYFARGGARIEAVPCETGKVAIDRMLAGKADLAVASETPIAAAILGGHALKIVATIEQTGRNIGIVARKDRGISSPADLRGKTVGYSKGTSGDYFLDTFLLANGLGRDSVRLVDLPPAELRKALLDGRIDAACSWQPHIAFLSNVLGGKVVLFQDEYIHTESLCVAARPEFVRDRPDQLRALLEGLVSALTLASESPSAAQAIVAARTRIDPAVVAKIWGDFDFGVNLDQSLLASLEDESRWLIETGAVPASKVPDFRSSFHVEGLTAVRPDAVQMILSGEGNRE
jgi:NitT/TauT family transport system substrate-binding protein